VAQIKYTKRETKRGLKITASVRLSCGWKHEEVAIVRDEQLGKRTLGELMQLSIQGHLSTCKEDH